MPIPLGRNVRTLRGRLRLSQVELASQCGLDPETVSRIETGLATNPQAGTLARLAEALKTTVAILEGYESASPDANGSAAAPLVHGATTNLSATGPVIASSDQASSDLPKSQGPNSTPAGEQPSSVIASPDPDTAPHQSGS